MKNHGLFTILAAISVIAILGIGIYCNSFKNEFLYDDISLIKDNAAIKNTGNIPDLFKHNIGHGSGDKEGMFYRPIQMLSYMGDHVLWGPAPLGYHITNTALHITVCVLFFIFALMVTGDIYPATFSALLYLAHPVHTQAVTYMSGRADSLVAIFILLMLLLQRGYWSARTVFHKYACYALILLCYALGLLSKENAPIALLLLLFTEYCTRQNASYSPAAIRRWAFYMPLIILTIVWFCAKNAIVATQTMRIESSPLMARLITVPRLIAGYLRISFFPADLHFKYGQLPFPKTIFQKGYIEPAVIFCALTAFICYLWMRGRQDRGYRSAFFGAGWFIIALIPYMNLILELNANFAEHWIYIAQMGLMLSFVCFTFRLASSYLPARRCLYALFFIAIIVFSLLTMRQNLVWRDYLVFNEHNAKYSDKTKNIYNNLALEYIKRGDFTRARELLRKALIIDPGYAAASNNLQKLEADINARER